MLQSIRNQASSWLVRALLILLIVSFAAWGAGDYITGGQDPEVAEVGDRSIPTSEMRAKVRRELDRIRNYFPGGLDMEQARSLGLVDAAVEQVIADTLTETRARRMGVVVSDDQVRAAIASEPAFQGPGGNFDRMSYEMALRRIGLTEQGFVNDLRRSMTREQLVSAVTEGTIPPVLLSDRLLAYREEARVADVAWIRADGITGVSPPDAATLEAFYRERAAEFRAPELRDFTALIIDPVRLAEEVAVSEAEIADLYEMHSMAFQIPSVRRIEQIVFNTAEAAMAAQRRLDEGLDFDALRTEVAQAGSGRYTDLGQVTPDAVVDQVAEVAFAMQEGAVSAPVESPLGWHLLRVTDVQEGRTRTLDEVRDQLRAELAEDRAIDSVYRLAIQVEDELAGGGTIEEAARALNLPLHRFSGVTAAGRTVDGDAIPNLPPEHQLLSTAFETGEGGTSRLVETPGGIAFVLRVDSIAPPAERPLAAVRDDVAEAWMAEERDRRAEAIANQIHAEVLGGRDLAESAAEHGVSVDTTRPLTRNDNDPSRGVVGGLVTHLFEAARGEPIVGPAQNGYAVAVVRDVRTADSAVSADQAERLRNQLSGTLSNELLQQYTNALRSEIGVSVNPRAMENLF